MIPALELHGIHKRFGPVHALRGADFVLERGEVHALLGENGAGKSTLMHIAGGVIAADAGTIVVTGRSVRLGSPRAARHLGIGLVHQHFTAIPALSVAENIALSAGWPVARQQELHRRAQALAERTGLGLPVDARTESLTVGERQRLEILKALASDATVLLLDEPTAVLAPAEAIELLRRLRDFADAGGAAVLITHKLDEALSVADRITVLRDGRTVRSRAAAAENAELLTAAMLGASPPTEAAAPRAVAPGPTLVWGCGISLHRGDGRGVALRAADLEAAAGEVLGLAAVDGNGQRELLRSVAGIVQPFEGTLDVSGPVAFVPEDRTTEGLILDLTLAHNVALGFGPSGSWKRGGRVDWAAMQRQTREMTTRFGVRGGEPTAAAGTLSGGNQQKLVVARALARRPRVVVAENPTRGLDVHAATTVWSALKDAAAAGAAVLVWSSDVDEIMLHSTRLIVVARGEIRGVPPGAGRDLVGAMMLGPAPERRP